MPKRSSKKRDINITASSILEEITSASENGKNPYAVLLGRRGGLKGGKARAEKLSPEERREIAKRAAKARWGK
jgi:hypothetical protein